MQTNYLVISAGAATSDLLKSTGVRIPVKESPGVLVRTKPVEKVLGRIVWGPGNFHAKQYSDGRILAGIGFKPPETMPHPEVLKRFRDFPDERLRAAHGNRILEKLAGYFPKASGASIERVSLGWRPIPGDGLPVSGFVDKNRKIYVSVAHSGITLAPILGKLAAQEITSGVEVSTLTPFRPDRFKTVAFG